MGQSGGSEYWLIDAERRVSLADVSLAIQVVSESLCEQLAIGREITGRPYKLDDDVIILRRLVVEQLHWWLDHPGDRARAIRREVGRS